MVIKIGKHGMVRYNPAIKGSTDFSLRSRKGRHNVTLPEFGRVRGVRLNNVIISEFELALLRVMMIVAPYLCMRGCTEDCR